MGGARSIADDQQEHTQSQNGPSQTVTRRLNQFEQYDRGQYRSDPDHEQSKAAVTTETRREGEKQRRRSACQTEDDPEYHETQSDGDERSKSRVDCPAAQPARARDQHRQ